MSTAPVEMVDLLAGLEEHRSCEHQDHAAMPEAHADGGEQFVRVAYPCCGEPSLVVVLCARVLTASWVRCRSCRTVNARQDTWHPLGPANPAA